MLKRKRRVRMHLTAPEGQDLPSVEGILASRRAGEYLIAVPQLILAVDAKPAVLESRLLAIPRERVAFYEVL